MICASIANIKFDELWAIVSEFDMIELRLDLLNFNNQEYQQIYSLGIPIIATYRYGICVDELRIKALQEAIVMGASFVDIEIDASPDFVSEMMRFAKENSCKTILSYHNFKLTPSINQLTALVEKSRALQSDYIKIACLAKSKKDVARVLSLYENTNKLIAFNMGQIGKVSRVASLFLGADFTYASVSKKNITAEGQFTYKEIKVLHKEINK